MAASAKWLARIGAALGHGASAAKECSCRVLKELPPPGYVINSAGLLLPVKHLNNVVRVPGRRMNMDFVEERVIEKMERATGLFFRFTKVVATTGACYFVLKLTWYETSEKGRLQYYLPGPNDNIEHASPVPFENTPAYLQAKSIVDEVNKEKIAEFSKGCHSECATGDLLVFIDAMVLDHKLTLIRKGLPAEHVAHFQDNFFVLLREAAKKCMVKSYNSKPKSPEKQLEEEGQPSK